MSITSGNEEAILPLLNHLVEIDIDKRKLIQEEWTLRTISMKLEDDGQKLNVKQEQSRNRMRQQSHVLISTRKGYLEGDVRTKPKANLCSIDLSYEKLRSCSEVMSIKVQKF